MCVSPLDIRQQQFTVRILRGLDPQEVEAFLEDVAEEYEQLLKENVTLREQQLVFLRDVLQERFDFLRIKAAEHPHRELLLPDVEGAQAHRNPPGLSRSPVSSRDGGGPARGTL